MLLKGRYLIEKELGRGGMGAVYLARDTRLHSKPVVIKVLLESVEFSEHKDWFKKHFLQEVEALARINHPGVVGIFDTDEMPDGKPFIVMQYIEGENLRSVMNPSGMEFLQVARLIRQIAWALSAAHEKGVWHRDLKPENIMLQSLSDEGEQIKLIDFGIASVRAIEKNTKKEFTKVAGTINYMAPEQLTGAPSAFSDIYALGVIAYEMLTGQLPFNPSTPYQLLEYQRAGIAAKPVELRADLPGTAQNAILKALAFEEKDRYQRASDFGEVLAQTLTDSGSSLPLEIAHVLFVDLVGYSKLPMNEQTRWLNQLQSAIRATSAYVRALSLNQLISLPTGDGMALVFFRDPIAPVNCAIELADKLRSHPELKLRMGIHSGPVYRLADINAHQNVAGGGINLAQRVMDCGDAGHILVSSTVADTLRQVGIRDESLHDLGEHEVKHGVRLHLFNLCSGDFGNNQWPEKLRGNRLYEVIWKDDDITRPLESEREILIEKLTRLNDAGNKNLGLKLWIETDQKNSVRPVRDFTPDAPTESLQFRLGDKVAICASVETDCYLRLLTLGSTGNQTFLFPRQTDGVGFIKAGEIVRIAGTLTGMPGTEYLHAFASVKPLEIADTTVNHLLDYEEAALQRADGSDCDAITIRYFISQ